MSDTKIQTTSAEIIVLPVAYSHGGFAQIRSSVASEPPTLGEAANLSDLTITALEGQEIANAG